MRRTDPKRPRVLILEFEAMKKESPQEEPSGEMANPASEEGQDDENREGRNGEGAHSAMKHWLHEERNRIKRHEH
jgi:hypothetical protein